MKLFASSIVWTALGTYSSQLVAFVVAAVLGRLLSPEDFGIIALLLTCSGFLSLFTKGGFAAAIIQNKGFSEKDLKTVIMMSLFAGVIFSLLFALCSKPISVFFDNKSLERVIQVSSLSLLFTSLMQVPAGIMLRDFKNKQFAFVLLIASLLSGVIAILMAAQGAGYWALVAQIVIRPFISLVLGFAMLRILPLPAFDPLIVKRVYGYAFNLVVFDATNYWARNLDNLMIGRFWGMSQLGFYSRAYAIFMLPLHMLSGVISPVLHSALVSERNNLELVRIRFLKAVKYVCNVSFPAMAVASVYSSDIIEFVYGPGWDESAVVFSILAVAGMTQPATSLTGAVFKARNKTRWLVNVGFLNTAVFAFGFLIGLPHGIIGIAWAYLIMNFILFTFIMQFVKLKLLGFGKQAFWNSFIAPIIITLPVFLVALLMEWLLPVSFECFTRLLSVGLATGIIYIVAIYVVDRRFFNTLMEILCKFCFPRGFIHPNKRL